MSRTQNSVKNIIASYGSQILLLVLDFIVRTVFIRTLGKEYLGISSLFSNILTFLSLTNLGFGTAITYKLYKPVEIGDKERVVTLLRFFRQVYIIIGFVIVGLGILISPFLRYLIKDFSRFDELNLNPYFIFAIFLFKTACSYWFFAYKNIIVRINQKRYLLTISSYGIDIASALVQIAVLVFLKNYILYLIVVIFFSILTNLIYSRIAVKNFPYINDKPKNKISKQEVKDIFKDCMALLIYKSSYAVINASDNLIISSFMGLTSVGIFSNYSTITSNIRSLLYTIITSISASIGSINATEKLIWKRNVFKLVNFMMVFFYGTISIGVAVMMDDFIKLWLGDEFIINSFMLNNTVYHYSLPLLIAIQIYIIGYNSFLSTFRQSLGLFQQLKWRPVASMIINLIVGLSLIKYIGVAATVLGTILGYGLTTVIADPIVINRTALKLPIKDYFIRNLGYTVTTIIAGSCSYFVCSFIDGSGIIHFIFKGCTCVAISVIVYFVCFFKTNSFKNAVSFIPKRFRSKLPKFIIN